MPSAKSAATGEKATKPAAPARWTPTRTARPAPLPKAAASAGKAAATTSPPTPPKAASPAPQPPRRGPVSTSRATSRIAAAVVEATRDAQAVETATATIAVAESAPSVPPRGPARKCRSTAAPMPPAPTPLDLLPLMDSVLRTRFATAGVETVNALVALEETAIADILCELAAVINLPEWLKLAHRTVTDGAPKE